MHCDCINILIVLIYVVLCFIIVTLIVLRLVFCLGQRVYVIRFKIFYLFFFADCEFLFNIWRFLFLFIVLFIRIRVMFFSCSYMRVYFIQNFILLYLSFVIRIAWLILNNNFYWMIFGWDGLGVVSFLLIIFYINQERNRNGLFTIFQNRIGDLFFVLFILGCLDLRIWRNIVLSVRSLCLIVGARVKRAQFPFNSWLLAAIRAPTPISSLVHSSTLVVAGVYILLQFRYCLVDCLVYLKWLRMLTLFIRLFGLINEVDIKKLIAFSTINHVALIILILRIKLYKVTYFHLNIHAIFKSLMFICFGFVILASYHRQDKRLVRIVYINPIIKIIYTFSCLCLIGLPFLTAFFSKDFIIEKRLEFRVEMRRIFCLLLFLGVRIYYSFKLLQLNKIIFVYYIVEKQRVGFVRIFLIVLVRIVLINVFIISIFSLSLEIREFKFFIYLIIFFFLILNLLTNLNFKLISYDKIKNWREVWLVDWYKCDQFVYWTFQNFLSGLVLIGNFKLVLLINWWVVIICIFIF